MVFHYNELQVMDSVLLIHEILAVQCLASHKWGYWPWGFFYENFTVKIKYSSQSLGSWKHNVLEPCTPKYFLFPSSQEVWMSCWVLGVEGGISGHLD